jgi:hypothetical protein
MTKHNDNSSNFNPVNCRKNLSATTILHSVILGDRFFHLLIFLLADLTKGVPSFQDVLSRLGWKLLGLSSRKTPAGHAGKPPHHENAADNHDQHEDRKNPPVTRTFIPPSEHKNHLPSCLFDPIDGKEVEKDTPDESFYKDYSAGRLKPEVFA